MGKKLDQPNVSLLPAIIGVIGVVIGALIGYFGTKTSSESAANAQITAVWIQVYGPISATQTIEARETKTAISLIPTFTDTPAPINEVDHVNLVEIVPQIGDGDIYWFFANNKESQFRFFTSRACSHSGNTGLQLNYSMNEPDYAGWGVEWYTSSQKYFDATGYTALVFWIKGIVEADPVQISMKDDRENYFEISLKDYLVNIALTDWTKIEIPLIAFTNVRRSSLTQLSIATFYARNGSGSICIDDITFQ